MVSEMAALFVDGLISCLCLCNTGRVPHTEHRLSTSCAQGPAAASPRLKALTLLALQRLACSCVGWFRESCVMLTVQLAQVTQAWI